jgi:hypothetical protein
MNPAHHHLPEVSTPEMARQVAAGIFTPNNLAWLQASFRQHVVEGVEIENALRLDRASRIRARDDALRRAAALLTLADDGPWNVALRLAQAVARHERKRGEPSTPLEAALAAAFAAGVRVPATPRQLYEICR